MNINLTPIQVDIVSAEASIYSGQALQLTATGFIGELGVSHGHSPLLTSLKPGYVRIKKADEKEELIYISGGILEVQPHTVTILANVATRAAELDEAAALAAKESAEQLLKQRQRTDIDYAQTIAKLAEAVAQLKLIEELRKKARLKT